ncbi:MAG: hypothetical protein AB1345_01050 [Chloroflexota bacterium]
MNEIEEVPQQEKKNNKTLIIIIVALVVLCCCCAVAVGGWAFWTYGDEWLDLTFHLSRFVL